MHNKLTMKRVLNLSEAKEIASATESEARQHEWNMSIAVQGDAGWLMYFQ